MATNFDVSSMLGKLSASQMAANERKLREHGLLPDSEPVAEPVPESVKTQEKASDAPSSEPVSETVVQVEEEPAGAESEEEVPESAQEAVVAQEEPSAGASGSDEGADAVESQDDASDESEDGSDDDEVADDEDGSDEGADDDESGEDESEEDASESADESEARGVERTPLPVGDAEDAGDEPIIEVTPDGTEISRGGGTTESVEIIRDRSLEGSESRRAKPLQTKSETSKAMAKSVAKKSVTKKRKKDSTTGETLYARGIPMSTMSEMRKIFPGNYATGDVIAAYVAYKSGNSYGLTARQRAILDQVQDSDPYQDIQATMRALKRMVQDVRDRCDVFEMALAYMMLDRMGAIADRPTDVTKAMLRMTPMEGFVEHLREEAAIFQQALRMKEGRPKR